MSQINTMRSCVSQQSNSENVVCLFLWICVVRTVCVWTLWSSCLLQNLENQSRQKCKSKSATTRLQKFHHRL